MSFLNIREFADSIEYGVKYDNKYFECIAAYQSFLNLEPMVNLLDERFFVGYLVLLRGDISLHCND